MHWMALSSSSSSCWTFGASFAKGSDAVPQDPDITDIPNLLELLGVKANFGSCRTARATSCNLQPASDYLTICVARRHDKFLAVFAIASIACQDLTKKESCYKAATWRTACLAKISSHLLRLLANHATGSCLAPTRQFQGKDFTATMTSPIPLNPLKWSPIPACTTFRYKCLYLKHGPEVQMSTSSLPTLQSTNTVYAPSQQLPGQKYAKIMFMEFVWGANLPSKDKDCAIAWNSRPKNGLLVKVVPHKCRMSAEHVRTVHVFHGVHEEGTSLLCLLEVVQKQMFQAHCRPWKWTVPHCACGPSALPWFASCL